MPSPPEDSGAIRRHERSPETEYHPDTVPDLHFEAIPARVERLASVRQVLTKWATSVGMITERVQALTLAVYEAMANVVTHAYRGCEGVFELHAVRGPDQVTVTVIDFGEWQPEVAHDPHDRLRVNGRGVLLIRALSDSMAIHSDANGTTIRMNWRLA